MVDAEEHLPSAQMNGHKKIDRVTVNGAGSEDDLNRQNNLNSHSPSSEKTKISEKVSADQSTSEKRKTSDEPTSHQLVQDVKMSDASPPHTSKSKTAKSSDENTQAIPTVVKGLTVFKSGGDSPFLSKSRSASAGTQDNDPPAIGLVKGQPYKISEPKTITINGRARSRSKSRSNGVLPSVEVDANDGHYASAKKHKVVSAQEDLAAEAEVNRLHKDTGRLRDVLVEVSHKSAQLILRENWRTFLFDPPDETHVAFILRAGLKNSTPGILQRVLKDDNVFKPPFLEAASQKPAMRKKVLDGITMEELLNDISREKLDEMVAHRIRTAPVKQLASWLTKGKRLGFEEDDIISEQHDELVIPNIPPPPQYRQPNHQEYRPPQHTQNHINNGMGMGMSSGPASMDPLLAEQNRQRELALQRAAAQRQALATPQVPIQGNLGNHPGPLICGDCRHVFTNFPGYHHHITKKPCGKEAPPGGFKWSCPNCLQGFTTKQGNDYHRLKGVCTATDIVASSPAIQALPAVPSNDGLPRPSSTPTAYVPPPVQGPSQSPWVSQQQQRPAIPPQPYVPSPYTQQQPQNQPPQPTAAVIPALPPPPPPQSAPPVVTSIEVAIPSPKADKKVPKPPLHTPAPPAPQTATFHSSTVPPTTRKQAPRKDVRVDPSDLSPEKLAALNRDLTELDRKFEEGVAELPADMDPELKANRIVSLKNANSSRKSQIRKNYGVTLRMRDKDKQHRNSKRASMTANNTGTGGSSSPSGSAATTPAPMAAPTPVARPKFDGLRASAANSPLSGPSVAGFSPVNTPSISGFSPVNRPKPNGNGTPPSSGFGVLTTKQPHFDNDRKRRHELFEHERRPGSGAGGYTGGIPSNSVLNSGLSGSGLAMVEMGSEDADERYRKEKVKVHVAGAHLGSSPAANGTNGESARRSSSGGPVIVIEDSEEEGDESQNAKGKKTESDD